MENDKLGRLKHLHKTLIDTASELHDTNEMLYEEPLEPPITADYANRLILQDSMIEVMEKINELTERLTKYTLRSE